MSERRRLASGVALATLALAVLLGIRPVTAERILVGYALAIAAIVLASLVRRTSAAAAPADSALERALVPSAPVHARPADLIRVERELALGSSSAGHLHSRLLPLLREAAAARLAAHHDVDLARRPDAARRLLGAEAWELLRPDLEPPEDRHARGLPLRRLRALVDTLEAL